MKNLNLKMILWALLLCCFGQGGYSQSLCLETPATEAEIVTCNRAIAHAFAPEINQLSRQVNPPTGSFPSTIFSGDIPGPVNYDGNWNGGDNWSNLANFTPNPSVYYTVWWLEEYWFIRYQIYYPRDYAKSFPVCLIDAHEHDMETINILVRRPTSQAEADDPSLLSYGTSISHHGEREYASCPPASTAGSTNIPYPQGIHPIIYSAIGSHGMYYSESDADTDDAPNPCRPDHNFIVTYFPSAASPQPVMNCTSASCFQPYTLIDMFDPTMGLWAQRDNDDLWDGDKFDCGNPIVCKVGKPWLGNAKTPICGFMDRLDIMCNPTTGESTPPNENGCDDYVYNGYCEALPLASFDLKKEYCCGDPVVLDGRATEGELWHKVDVREVGGVGEVTTDWVYGSINFVDLDVLWSAGTSGGKFQSGKTYEVCLTPKDCAWGDKLCQTFTFQQPSFDFVLQDSHGDPLPDGSDIEPGSRPRLVPTELSCIKKYSIKICESPITEGKSQKRNDCTWYYSDAITSGGPVDLYNAMNKDWTIDFSFQEGYQYQICMFSEGTCTETICQTLKATGEPTVICIEETETTFPFCYAVITNCPPETFCDPCFNGGAICLYDEAGDPLDLSDFVFSIDLGNYIIGSDKACFQFSPEQAALIQGFYVYFTPWKTSYYVPLELCKVGIGGEGPGFKSTLPAIGREAAPDDENSNGLSIEVFPNPSNGMIFISSPTIRDAQVRVSSILGQEIFRGDLENNQSIDLTSFEKGVYLVSILDQNLRPLTTQKIIKQ